MESTQTDPQAQLLTDASQALRRRRRRKITLYTLLAALTAGGAIGWATTPTGPTTTTPSVAPGEDAASVAKSFTDAQPGQCINWSTAADGTVSNFQIVDCAGAHRFEVSRRENLATYPTSEFGPNAAIPDRTRQAALTKELCEQPTLAYLGGRFDPNGRFSIAPILPPQTSWANGDRTLLCGIQITGQDGTPTEFTGTTASQDQSHIYQVGQCVNVADDATTTPVDCAQPHSYEVTSIVDVSQKFPTFPAEKELDDYLAATCADAAIAYTGSDDNLYNSTLAPFWTSLTEDSWKGGSRNVNCALAKIRANTTFAVLAGSAKGPFTIDGAAPPPQPVRPPLRNE